MGKLRWCLSRMSKATEKKLTLSLYDSSYDKVNQCIQCGYCLPACPTYDSMEKESASPRGRINLVKAAAEGKIDVLEDLKEPIDLCLGCRACEVACPVDVPYGSILEDAKETIHKMEVARKEHSIFKDWLLNSFFTNPKLIGLSSHVFSAYQNTGLQKVARKFNLPSKVLGDLGTFEASLPKLPSSKYKIKKGTFYEAKTDKPLLNVALFMGCINDAILYKINYYSLELLRLAGCNVYIPEEQNCCGALHAHQGYMDTARELAVDNIKAFEKYAVDYIVTNAGGCGAILTEYDHLLSKGKDPQLTKKAQSFSGKIKDISEILFTLGSLPLDKKVEKTVTYQPSCHLTNVQKVNEAPEKLINNIPGVKYVELADKNTCCASGGIYNVINYDESMEILNSKFNNVNRVKPDVIVTSNVGCLLQMSHGINQFADKKQIQSIHLVELLAEACNIQCV
jgi:glycolate oxidase iron-sulfur subunit